MADLQTTISEDLAPTPAEKAFASAGAEGLEWQSLGAPILADVDRIVAALDPVADGALTVAAQPDVPRNITMTIVDANASSSGVCTVKGLDMAGLALTEVFTWAAAGTQTGTGLFATVTSAVVSGVAGAAAGDTISVGVGNRIAMPKQIATEGAIKLATFGAVPITPDAIGLTPASYVDANGATYDGSSELKIAYKPGQ
jgi:hypothetical protein